MSLLRKAGLVSLSLCICSAVHAQVKSVERAHFQIEGTVTDQLNAIVPGAEITFHGETTNVTVYSDEKGSYRADLPLGAYTMDTRVSQGFRAYKRPLFRIDSPIKLVMDIHLVLGRNNCDIVVVGKDGQPATSEAWEEAAKHFCGGQDSFPLPSKDGTPYQVLIQYPRRSQSASGYDYSWEESSAVAAYTPVFVAYNLFTLEAEHVSYDIEHHRINATGHIVVTRQGSKTTSESLDLILADGGVRSSQ